VNVLACLLVAMSLVYGAVPKTREVQWASPIQGEAFRYGPYPMCMSGGWGSGKTFAGCLKGIWLSTEYPHNRGVIARHIGRELKETTMATFYKTCPPSLYDRRFGGRRNDQNGYLKFAKTGSEVLFLHLDDPDTAGIIKGLEINWFLIDQAEENPDEMEELFDLLCARLGRWDIAEVPERLINEHFAETGQPWPFVHPEKGTPVPPPYPMLACNPDVEVHWIYRRFHPQSHEHQTLYKPQGYRMFDMPSEDNRFLGQTNLRFLLSKDAAFIRRNVKGIWGLAEGSIHVVPKESEIEGSPELLAHLQATCLLFRTMDHGDSAPTCVLWWAVDKNGNVFCYREYYLPNALVSTHRQNTFDLSTGERYEQDLADPSIMTKMPQRKGGRWSVADEWGDVTEQPRNTAIFWQPADNNELGTRNRINEYLQVDPDRIHPITKERGAPRLFFVKVSDSYPQGCYHTLRQMRAQRRVKIGTELGRPIFSDERDPDVVDHAYDPVRYFIASRAPVPKADANIVEGTFAGAQRLAKLHRRRLGLPA
jgi:hypothetical protein